MTNTIMLVAGEPSGDALGASLMAALKSRSVDNVRFIGVGGPAMISVGMESLFPLNDLSVMGVVEVLPRLPLILRRLGQAEKLALGAKPDVLVTIDAPDFNFRLSNRLKGRGIPLVHYVAPTVWSWKPGRAKKIAGFLDHLMTLLPFEPPYFDAVGLPCTFVGHPVIEGRKGQGSEFRQRHHLRPDELVLGVLPGSRTSEITRLLPIFRETLRTLMKSHAELRVVVVAVDHLREIIAAELAEFSQTLVMVGSDEKADAFAAMDGALAASGTVVLELSLAAVPTVVGYRLNPLTAAIVRRMAIAPSATLSNLIMGEHIVPEYLQNDCTPANLVPAVEKILLDEEARNAQIQAAEEIARALGLEGSPPADRAADVVLEIIDDNKDRGP